MLVYYFEIEAVKLELIMEKGNCILSVKKFVFKMSDA